MRWWNVSADDSCELQACMPLCRSDVYIVQTLCSYVNTQDADSTGHSCSRVTSTSNQAQGMFRRKLYFDRRSFPGLGAGVVLTYTQARVPFWKWILICGCATIFTGYWRWSPVEMKIFPHMNTVSHIANRLLQGISQYMHTHNQFLTKRRLLSVENWLEAFPIFKHQQVQRRLFLTRVVKTWPIWLRQVSIRVRVIPQITSIRNNICHVSEPALLGSDSRLETDNFDSSARNNLHVSEKFVNECLSSDKFGKEY